MRFAALEVALSDVTALFASHLRVDHVGDFAAYWVSGRLGGRLDRLDSLGPSGSEPEHGFASFSAHQLSSYSWYWVTRSGLMSVSGDTVNVTEFGWSATDVVYEHNGVIVTSFPAVRSTTVR